jgi:hypothetical protein
VNFAVIENAGLGYSMHMTNSINQPLVLRPETVQSVTTTEHASVRPFHEVQRNAHPNPFSQTERNTHPSPI